MGGLRCAFSVKEKIRGFEERAGRGRDPDVGGDGLALAVVQRNTLSVLWDSRITLLNADHNYSCAVVVVLLCAELHSGPLLFALLGFCT